MRGLLWALLVLALTGVLGLSLILGKPTSAVDWRPLRAVAFESDDWGLQGFIPAAGAWEGLDRASMGCGSFPEVYWSSTLEDSTMVADLCRLMNRFQGREGLPPVFQPNYVMSGLGLIALVDGKKSWHRFDLPDLDPRYSRPGLWQAVADGIESGVWWPELHATWHYDPLKRREAALQAGVPAAATDRGIMLFPGSERARELGNWRELEELTIELDHSLAVFQGLFGRSPISVIAPDYHWNRKHEEMWNSRGLKVIQAKKEQKNLAWGRGLRGRLAKIADRSVGRLLHPGRVYLERNCRFEPVQNQDPGAVVTACLEETRLAWDRAQPAIVETHRVNFAHVHPAVVSIGLKCLASYLEELTRPAELMPTFLTDWEISQLQNRGTSWSVRGGRIVVRNGTRSARLITIPAEDLNLARERAGLGPVPNKPHLLALKAGETRILAPKYFDFARY
ncbi:MAG: hypothetical protein KOO60_13725 [Gemmatimonadales bacterium]|nr:hypothetical protein [Gemmatimonadales bacterium]